MQRLSSPKLAWFSLSLFYMYQYVLRVFPSVAEQELRTDLLLSAADFSSLGAMYLYAYGGLQLPLGAIVDRLGLKKVALVAISMCILGACIFYWSTSLWQLQLGRLLMGIGSAPVFMCSLKICADYIPAGHRGLYMGTTLTMGTLGALISGNLVVSLLESIGWRLTILALGGLGLLIAPLITSSLPSYTQTANQEPFNFDVLKKVFKNKIVYIYGILGLGLFSSLTVIADLWGTAYLTKRYGVMRSDAASAAMTMYIGLAIGSLVLPWYFEKKDKIFTGLKLSTVVLISLFFSFMFIPDLPFAAAKIILFLLGLFSGAIMMSFTGAALETTKETSGLTISIVNAFNMFGGAILSQTVGGLLEHQWDGALLDGVPQYSLEMFDKSFTIVLGGLFVICLIIAMQLKQASHARDHNRSKKT
jgi:MFS family permease